jgi:hypothetical protein
LDLITSIPPKIERRNRLGAEVGIDYLRDCVQSWRRSGFQVRTLNREREADHIGNQYALDPELFQDESEALFPNRFGPSFHVLIASLDPSTPIGIINADIYLLDSQDLPSKLETLCQKAFVFARRTDVADLTAPFHSNYNFGVDFVAFRPDLISEVFQDRDFKRFQLGLVWWDLVLPIAASFYAPVLRIREPFILHHLHERAWDSAVYRNMQVKALETLRRLGNAARHSSPAAGLFTDLAAPLDLADKKGEHAFSQLCTDWLAGEVGPIGQVELRLDLDQGALTELLRANLEECTNTKLELERGRKELERKHKEIVKLRELLAEAKRANSKITKVLSKAEARQGTPERPTGSAKSAWGFERLSKALRRKFWLRPRRRHPQPQ